MSINPLNLFATKPSISTNSVQVKKDLSIHYRHDLPGELQAPKGFSHHLITFFLTDNELQTTHLEGHGEYDGKMAQGEFYLYPARVSGFTRWQGIDKTLHLIIKPHLLEEIALKTECLNPERIELRPVLKKNDPNIEQLAQLYLREMQSELFGGQLYLESLSNLLGVHLLRHYCVFEPVFRQYNSGLASAKIRQTIDYIQSNLDQNLSLKVMAAQVGMDRYYFATQFKQAMGISPYQYVIKQRIKKAKYILRQQKFSLVEIALSCGFSSQSHFNRVFRQQVGTTPKKYQEQF